MRVICRNGQEFIVLPLHRPDRDVAMAYDPVLETLQAMFLCSLAGARVEWGSTYHCGPFERDDRARFDWGSSSRRREFDGGIATWGQRCR